MPNYTYVVKDVPAEAPMQDPIFGTRAEAAAEKAILERIHDVGLRITPRKRFATDPV